MLVVKRRLTVDFDESCRGRLRAWLVPFGTSELKR